MIDERAVIDPSAKIGRDVSIGPYSIVGPDVEINDGTWIGPHVVIRGPTLIGRDNKIFQFSSIGDIPQDKKFAGESSRLEIGDRNVIRECVTINRGTAPGGGITRLGHDNWIMAYVHIAHDCHIGNNTIFANGASLAGHVAVDDFTILGGFTLVHQFCAIGTHCFTAMNSVISKDVPPYLMVAGHMARPRGLNTEGLKRHGVSPTELRNLRNAYKTIYRSGLSVPAALEQLVEIANNSSYVAALISFIRNSKRGIIR